MELTLDKKALSGAVKALAGVVEKRNTVAILSYLKLTAKDGKLTIEATDMDIHAIKVIDANIKVEGELAVNAETFANIVLKSVGDDLGLTLKDGFIYVKSGKSRFKVAVLDSKDFPSIDSHDFSHEMTISAQELTDLIAYTSFCASREEMRYHLCGVYLHQHGQNLRAVATDGHRLALHDIAMPDGGAGMDGVIIPNKTLSVISRFAAIGSANLKLFISPRKIKVQGERSIIVSKVIDGQYPDYERIIPTENDKNFIVNRDELRDTIDRVSVVSDPKRNSVNIHAKDGKFLISASGIDGANADEDLEIGGNDEVSICYNKNYIHEALAHVGSEKCKLSMRDGAFATVITDENIGNSLFLVMPIRG